MKKIKEKLKEIELNKLHFILGFFILLLVFFSYSFVGEVDTTKTDIKENPIISIPGIGMEIDLKTTSLFLAAVVIGLLDGFNPCAMWVLIYLISLVTTIGDRKKMYLIVGTFVATEAIMYFFVLAGWLNLFEFIGISTWFLYLVGAFAIWTGVFSVKDYIENKGQIVCKVGDVKSKKKIRGRIEQLVESKITIATLFGVIMLAIVVNSIEFVCSAGLPAIFTQMLALSNIDLISKYFYIFVYDIFFMLDDFIIFGLAIWAINSNWTTKYSGYSKLIGGIIMVLIGFMLLFFPTTLF